MGNQSSHPELARSIYLLWGHHPASGRSGLSVLTIVEAGVAIADAEGLDAVSMRKVAHHLDVGAMSLYGHVPGKADLTSLMVDAVHSELYDDVEEAQRSGDWRAAMQFVAQRNWDSYRRHPWMLDLRPERIALLGPHVARKYETELRPLDGTGLSDLEMDAALTLILGHVESSARTYRDLSRTADDSGMSDAEWWNIAAPILDQVVADEDLQVAGRVGGAVGAEFNASSSPEYAFEFGLEAILDGIAARIDRP